MEISPRVLVILGGTGILTYLIVLLYGQSSTLTTAQFTRINGSTKKLDCPCSALDAGQSPVMHINGSTKKLGRKSQTNPDPAHPAQVLILTYTRSGSSLTGDILQHSQEAFYVYEPFRFMGDKNLSNFVIEYADGSKRKPPYSFQEETYNALYSWFSCNITKIPVMGLMDPFMTRAIKTSAFRPCYEKQNKILKNQSSAVTVCARNLQGICSDSPFRIIKTVRIQLHDIKHLLEDLPNLKIIHLVRDPRATLLSRAQLGWCASSELMTGCANYYCKRLENNVLEEERLMKTYPGRLMPVFYEDIAKQPLETSKKLYNFIGANFTLEAQKYIYNITMAGQKDNCEICTTRSNSSLHTDAWKKNMNIDYVKIINERCNYILMRYEFDEIP